MTTGFPWRCEAHKKLPSIGYACDKNGKHCPKCWYNLMGYFVGQRVQIASDIPRYGGAIGKIEHLTPRKFWSINATENMVWVALENNPQLKSLIVKMSKVQPL